MCSIQLILQGLITRCALVQSAQHQLPDLYVTPNMRCYQLHWLANKNIFCFLLKFGVILTVSTLLNPNMTPKLPDHPAMLREEIKFKNYICNKKSNILVFNYNIYSQRMNKFIIHSLRLLFSLIFGRW